MSVKRKTIQDEIFIELDEKIDDKTESFNKKVISEKEKEIENKNVQLGTPFVQYVRDIRNQALSDLQSVKDALVININSRAIDYDRASGINKLHIIKQEIEKAKTEKEKLLRERENIYEKEVPLPNYQKYIKYGHSEYK